MVSIKTTMWSLRIRMIACGECLLASLPALRSESVLFISIFFAFLFFFFCQIISVKFFPLSLFGLPHCRNITNSIVGIVVKTSFTKQATKKIIRRKKYIHTNRNLGDSGGKWQRKERGGTSVHKKKHFKCRIIVETHFV